ncbi:MAG TPA: amidase family protein, partial [Roseomonas sp.]
MTSPAALSAAEAARRIRAGTLTATALAEAYLDRIAAEEPRIRAFAWLDPALVRRQAAAVDAGEKTGALAGIPFAIKDVLDTAD